MIRQEQSSDEIVLVLEDLCVASIGDLAFILSNDPVILVDLLSESF